MIKQIFIPVAALAITATSVSAFNDTDLLKKLNISLTDTEVAALEEVREIRETAQAEAKQVLADAGISEERMREIHAAMHDAQKESREAVKAAIEANDYTAYQAAVADTPLADDINSEAEFTKLVEAHTLMKAGDKDGAKAIMDELGIKGPGMMGDGKIGGRGGHPHDN